MDPLLVAAAIAVAAGTALQSATGFGFALVSAPLLFAALEPREAIGLLLMIGIEIGILTIATERRRPQPLLATTATLLAWAVPASVAGVAVLRSLDAVTLQLAVTAGVAATLVARRVAGTRSREPRVPEPRWAAPLTGLSAGALVTSTNTSGPPLLLYLLGRGEQPGRVRDTLAFTQLGLNVIGALALVVTATSGAAPGAAWIALFVPLVALAHLAGRPLFARLARSGQYEPVLTGILVASVATGLVTTAI